MYNGLFTNPGLFYMIISIWAGSAMAEGERGNEVRVLGWRAG